MDIIRLADGGYEAKLAPLMNRSAFDADIDRSVAEILAAVRSRGDAALSEYASRFDHVTLTPVQFQVTADEIAAAAG